MEQPNEGMQTEATSLLAYVIDDLTEQHQDLLRQKFSLAHQVTAQQILDMVNSAIDAYEGGAR